MLEGLDKFIAEPARDVCQRDLRTSLLIGKRLNPFNLPELIPDCFSVRANFLVQVYEQLFNDCKLTEIKNPGEDPSNTWDFAAITNGMLSGGIITVNSNGLKLVDVWMSNSTPILKPHWCPILS